ncbi:MAG: class I tRNA ligase family protein, partial [Patescibacteria group bacterium]
RRRFYLILWNIYKYFVDYSLLENISVIDKKAPSPKNVLDRWILSRYSNVQNSVNINLKNYDARSATALIESLVTDISTWFIRRSRSRLWLNSDNKVDKQSFYATFYFILKNLSIILSPFTPFIAEEIYTNLTKNKSVHLADWPDLKKEFIDDTLEKDMSLVRNIVEKGHASRKEENLALRQPLSSATIYLSTNISKEQGPELKKMIEDELNVKKITLKKGETLDVVLDTKLTKDLLEEGEARKIIRMIQSERKKLGANPEDYVNVYLTDWPVKFEKVIKEKALIRKLIKAKEFKVSKV